MSNCSIRGAITVEEDTRECVLENTTILLQKIIDNNNININNIVSILFTATKDIDSVYPAVAAREIGITQAGLMCMQEMYVQNSLEMCIRVLVTIETDLEQKDMNHVYLKNAETLRPDIIKTNKNISIAIDGPAGSGKSTIAKMLAKEMNYVYVDTGAMYRTVGLYCINNNIDYNSEKEVSKNLDKMQISFIHNDGEQKILLNNNDVTELIRTQEFAKISSAVAKISAVREKLVDIQRNIANENNVVMDGRDIGTYVLPNANVKIFMEANIDERTKRRCHELSQKGIEYNFYSVKDEIIKRDENDKNRKISPLRKADDAILLDTSKKDIDAVIKEVKEIVNKKIK